MPIRRLAVTRGLVRVIERLRSPPLSHGVARTAGHFGARDCRAGADLIRSYTLAGGAVVGAGLSLQDKVCRSCPRRRDPTAPRIGLRDLRVEESSDTDNAFGSCRRRNALNGRSPPRQRPTIEARGGQLQRRRVRALPAPKRVKLKASAL